MKHNHPSMKVIEYFDINSKSQFIVNLRSRIGMVRNRCRPNNLPSWSISNAKNELATTFVGDCYAVLVDFGKSKRTLCFFEFKVFVLEWLFYDPGLFTRYIANR